MKCPTEIAIDDRREAELAKLGFMPILHRKNTDIAAFIAAHNAEPRPFRWTKSADDILASIERFCVYNASAT